MTVDIEKDTRPIAVASRPSSPGHHLGQLARELSGVKLMTDQGNAELFADVYGSRLRYDHARKRWLLYTGTHWAEDLDGAVYRLGMQVQAERRKRAETLEDGERRTQIAYALRSESRQRIDAMLALAKNLDPITTKGTEWDTDPYLLGTPSGVIDLRTSKLRDGRPEDHITKLTGVRYDPDAKAPRWERFLTEVTGDDAELSEYLRLAIGYSLTGDIREQVFQILYGDGANGKSTLLNTISYVWGDYALAAPFTTFTAGRYGDSGPTNDLARLDGARFVIATEPNEGASFNEGRVKQITGGDPITARFLHKEHFTFTPQLKLWLAANSKPSVRDLSTGFWRRVRLIGFPVNFAEAGQADDKLTATLRAEGPGILAWAVRACREWQERNLTQPDSVIQAVAEYREESDPVADFIAARLTRVNGEWTSHTALYSEYCDYLPAAQRLGTIRFGRAMEAHFAREQRRAGKGFADVRITDSLSYNERLMYFRDSTLAS
jgi:putative DNA primase/helicase